MTSEVVVMNSLAVALAADSAATVSNGRDNKVYNSANKLFMLSKHHPVGVMVYNNSSLLGIPWETLLKMFRQKLGTQEFDRLEEYGEALIKFLDQNAYLFPEDSQHRSYLALVETLYEGIHAAILEKIEEQVVRLPVDSAITEAEVSEIARGVISKSLEEWQTKEDTTCFSHDVGRSLAGSLSGEIQRLIAKVLGQFSASIGADATNALREIAIMLVSKDDILIESHSGLVVAGFGRKDYFPVMQMYELGEVYSGRLKHRTPKIERISVETPSVVKPFAHSEMVDTFLRGVNSVFEVRMIEEFVNLVVRLPNEVIDAISDLSNEQKAKWKDHVLPKAAEPISSFVRELEKHRIERHRGPILQAIVNLPIDELAHVAQSLVNLNSFQKRMSLGPETVGGPVDVAVISKGDGFIWIERKHYFKPELNPHYFGNLQSSKEAPLIGITEGEADV